MVKWEDNFFLYKKLRTLNKSRGTRSASDEVRCFTEPGTE